MTKTFVQQVVGDDPPQSTISTIEAAGCAVQNVGNVLEYFDDEQCYDEENAHGRVIRVVCKPFQNYNTVWTLHYTCPDDTGDPLAPAPPSPPPPASEEVQPSAWQASPTWESSEPNWSQPFLPHPDEDEPGTRERILPIPLVVSLVAFPIGAVVTAVGLWMYMGVEMGASHNPTHQEVRAFQNRMWQHFDHFLIARPLDGPWRHLVSGTAYPSNHALVMGFVYLGLVGGAITLAAFGLVALVVWGPEVFRGTVGT